MTAAWATSTADPCACPWCTIAAAIWASAKDAPDRPLSRMQLAALEVDGPDPLIEAAFYPAEYGDRAADEAHDRSERAAESALEWLERGGVR